jgi:N-acetylmuramoyl-L-alanine amidase
MRRAIPWLGLFLIAISFVAFLQWRAPQQVATRPRPLQQGKKKPFVIVLDPGHGGQDSGAMCGAVLEKDLTLDVALRAELLLRRSGFTTVLTRTNDRYLSLAERAAVANSEDDSLFVSIHFNDTERTAASGVETYFAERQGDAAAGLFAWLSFLQPPEAKPLTAESESLARFIQAAMVERTRAANRGTKSEQFYVITNVRHPAALVEGGFITNPSDVMKLGTVEYRQELAAGICEGIHRYREVLQPNEPTLALAAPAE